MSPRAQLVTTGVPVNNLVFYRSDAFPVAQPTVSEHRRQKQTRQRKCNETRYQRTGAGFTKLEFGLAIEAYMCNVISSSHVAYAYYLLSVCGLSVILEAARIQNCSMWSNRVKQRLIARLR